jgi:hypothetical protein
MATVPNEENTCLLCLDIGEEQLLANTRCPCKYNYHASCFTQYVKNNSCPLCKTVYITPEPQPHCCGDVTLWKALFIIMFVSLIGVFTASFVR